MNNKLNKILKHYGEENQLQKLEEEISELYIEIDQILMDYTPKANPEFLGEVADVLVLCKQFALKYPDINNIIEFKINRQIDRIGAEG